MKRNITSDFTHFTGFTAPMCNETKSSNLSGGGVGLDEKEEARCNRTLDTKQEINKSATDNEKGLTKKEVSV